MSAARANSIAPDYIRPAKSLKGFHAVTQSITSKAVILALQAGTGILTARELRPWGRGELAAMILWPLLVASVTTLGVPSSLIYFLRHRPEERDRLVTNGIIMSVILGSAAAIVTTAILPLCLHEYAPSIVHAAQWFLITVPICSVTLTGRAVLEAAHDFSASNAIQILTPLATLIVLVVFLGLHCFNPYTAAIAYIVASIPALCLMVSHVRRIFTWQVGAHIAVVRQILSYGIRSYGIDVLGTLALYVDQVLVIGLLMPGAMGSYVVVLSLSRMLNIFQNSVVMVLFPKSAGRPAREVVDMTGNAVRISTLVTALCGILVCAAGPSLLRIFYGSEYVAAARRSAHLSGRGCALGSYLRIGAGIHGSQHTGSRHGPAGDRTVALHPVDDVADPPMGNLWSSSFAPGFNHHAAGFCDCGVSPVPQDESAEPYPKR